MELDEIDEILFDFKQKLQKFEESQGELFKNSSLIASLKVEKIVEKPKKIKLEEHNGELLTEKDIKQLSDFMVNPT